MIATGACSRFMESIVRCPVYRHNKSELVAPPRTLLSRRLVEGKIISNGERCPQSSLCSSGSLSMPDIALGRRHAIRNRTACTNANTRLSTDAHPTISYQSPKYPRYSRGIVIRNACMPNGRRVSAGSSIDIAYVCQHRTQAIPTMAKTIDCHPRPARLRAPGVA